MTWRRVALYWAVFLAALIFYRASRVPPNEPSAEGVPEVRLLDLDAGGVSEVRLVRGDQRVRCLQEAGRWTAVEPANARVPADLIKTFVTTLAATTVAEEITEGAENASAFGLGEDALRVELYERGHETPVTVRLGGRTPTETAVYAQLQGMMEVVVVGRVLVYYARRIFEEASRGTPHKGGTADRAASAPRAG